VRRYARVKGKTQEIVATSQYTEFKLGDLLNASKYIVTPEKYPSTTNTDPNRVFVNRAIASTRDETCLKIGERLSLVSSSRFEGRTVAFDLMSNTPKKPDSFQQLEKKDGVFLMWTYYRDGYGIGRSGSNVGTYMGLGNFSPAFRNFSEAISTLSHHPQGFNSYDSTAQLREDNPRLEKGVKMWKVSENDYVDVQGALSIAKTDSQEIIKYFNHGSFKNHGCCPHCQVCVCHDDSIDSYSSSQYNIRTCMICAHMQVTVNDRLTRCTGFSSTTEMKTKGYASTLKRQVCSFNQLDVR
jgi:hypothetical protein